MVAGRAGKLHIDRFAPYHRSQRHRRRDGQPGTRHDIGKKEFVGTTGQEGITPLPNGFGPHPRIGRHGFNEKSTDFPGSQQLVPPHHGPGGNPRRRAPRRQSANQPGRGRNLQPVAGGHGIGETARHPIHVHHEYGEALAGTVAPKRALNRRQGSAVRPTAMPGGRP